MFADSLHALHKIEVDCVQAKHNFSKVFSTPACNIVVPEENFCGIHHFNLCSKVKNSKKT